MSASATQGGHNGPNGKHDTERVHIHAMLTFTDALVRFMNSRRLLSSVLSILKRFGFFSTISNHVLSEISKQSNVSYTLIIHMYYMNIS